MVQAFSKNLSVVLLITLIVLAIPLVVMQFSSEVDWSVTDFLVAGMLLFVFGSVINLFVVSKIKTNYKTIAIILSILLFLLLWVEMAVGLFGSPIAGN